MKKFLNYVNRMLALLCAAALVFSELPVKAGAESVSGNSAPEESVSGNSPSAGIRAAISYYKVEAGERRLFSADDIYEEDQTIICNADILAEFEFSGCRREDLAALSVFRCAGDREEELWPAGSLAAEDAPLTEGTAEDGSFMYILDIPLGEDGAFRFKIKTEEGTSVLLAEGDPAEPGSGEENHEETGEYTTAWTLVRDTVRPKLTSLVITPEEGAAHKELNAEHGNRYYFNKGFSVTAIVEDENLDEAPGNSTLSFRRAEDMSEENSETVTFSGMSSFSGVTSYVYDGEKAVFTDTVSADGVYAYALFGTDLAGNSVEPGPDLDPEAMRLFSESAGVSGNSAEENEALISRYIAVDTVKPAGTLTITAGGQEAYVRETGAAAPSYSMPYRIADSAVIALETSDAERTPVRVTLNVEEKNGTKEAAAASGGFIFRGSAVKKIDERMIFWVREGLIEDLAGNVSEPVSSRKIYLDKEGEHGAPDTIAPVVNIVPVIKDDDYDNEGRPLCNADAQFMISVIEPYSSADGTALGGRTSSGLKSVTWQVTEKADGTSVHPSAGQLYHHASTVSEGGEIFADDEKIIYEFDNNGKALTVPANELTNRNDLRIILTAEDNAGNRRVTFYDFGMDITPPAVTVAWGNNDVVGGRYFNAARTAVITVTERNFDPDLVKVEISAKDFSGNENTSLYSDSGWSARKKSGSFANGDGDVFVRTIEFREDGEFSLRVGNAEDGADFVCDIAGNRGTVVYEGAASADFAIDTEAPTVRVSMDDESVRAQPDGNYYYRADNCGFRVIFGDTGCGPAAPEDTPAVFSAELSGGKEKFLQAGSGENVLFFSKEEVAAAGDGPHTIRVRAVDAAGNAAESVAGEESSGCIFSGLEGKFVLDTKAPVFRLFVSSSASANQSLNKERGNRYYFGSEYTMTVQVTDANFDADRVTVKRGSVTGGDYDSSEVRVGSYDVTVPNVRSEDAGGQTYIFRDTVSADGVYRYAVFGSDKAGNALAASPGSFNLDGRDAAAVDLPGEKDRGSLETEADTSCHIVVDTVGPAGVISIANASGFEYFRMLTSGNVEKAEPYRDEDRAAVTFSVDPKTERSPVRLSYEVTADPSRLSQSGQSDDYVYGNSMTAAVSGRQRFKVTEFTLTDLAGNTVTAASKNFIYLDLEKPVQDLLAPVTSISASAPAAVRSGSGQDLFGGDVTLALKVEDPYAGQSGSGLADVYTLVYVNGAMVDADTRMLHRANAEHRALNYADPALDHVLESTVTVTAADHNYNDIRFVVTAFDNAGNFSTNEYRFGIDVTSPAIHVEFDNNDALNGRYFREERTAEVTVTERNFHEAAMRIATESGALVSGWTHNAGNSANGDDDTWVCTVTYRTDGHYTLSVSGADLVGRTAEADYEGTAPRDFVLDRTAPVLAVSYDNNDAENEKYFRADRTAVLTVTDANFEGTNDIKVFAAGGGSAPGVSFSGKSARLAFAEDGLYSFGGTVTDMAGNVSNTIGEPLFVIDKTLPEIELSGVEDLSANAQPLAITLTMKDANLDVNGLSVSLAGTSQGEIDGAGERSGIEGGVRYALRVTEDDHYRLAYTAADLAGNSVTGSVSFSENQTGTVFTFLEEVRENGCVSERFTPAYILQNLDEVTILSVTLNGEEVPCTYADGRLTFENELPSDGKYVITADVADAAGNRNSDRQEFIVDTQSPKLTVLGLADEALYFDELVITLRREEPTDIFTEIRLDGEILAEGDGTGRYKTAENGDVYITVSDYAAHELCVKLRDEAGNVTEWPYSFRLTDSILLRWYGGKPAYLVPAVILAVLFIIFLWLRRKKKRKENG